MAKHPYHSVYHRAFYSLLLIAAIMTIGTVGVHLIEGLSYLDAFYFMSMIATAQGTAQIPATALGKIFVAIMAFVSVGSAVAALGFLFGPFLGQLFHVGRLKLERESKQDA